MSSFTPLTRDAIQYLGAKATFDNGVLKIEGNVGLSTYPIHDSAHREILNSKILREYWFYEIGVETAEMWRFNIESDMHKIMPQFNELYKSLELEYNPLLTVDIRTTSEAESQSDSERTGSSESEQGTVSETDSKGRVINANYPQSMLRQNADYASNGADSISESDVKSTVDSEEMHSETSKDVNAGKTDSTTTGYQGIPSDLVMAYRAAIINVDQMVVDSLAENFMHIYNNGSTYSDYSTYERYTH